MLLDFFQLFPLSFHPLWRAKTDHARASMDMAIFRLVVLASTWAKEPATEIRRSVSFMNALQGRQSGSQAGNGATALHFNGTSWMDALLLFLC
jgi:hypothetical protein